MMTVIINVINHFVSLELLAVVDFCIIFVNLSKDEKNHLNRVGNNHFKNIFFLKYVIYKNLCFKNWCLKKKNFFINHKKIRVD